MNLTPLRHGLGVLVCAALVVSVGIPVGTQSRSLPDAPGVWKPWKPLSATTSMDGARSQAAAPALIKAFEDELLALKAILQRAPAVASPVGFSVETWGWLTGYETYEHAPGRPAAGKLPVAGGLTFAAFHIFEYQQNGKTIREDTGETAQQQILINQIGPGAISTTTRPEEWGGLSTDAFPKPMPQGEYAGLPRYDDALIIARDPATLWTPLSQRDALNLVAEARKLTIAEHEENLEKSRARLAVIRDPGYRPKRMKETQDTVAAVKMPPAQAQAFIKSIEQSLDIEEKSLLDEIGPSTGTGKKLADAQRALAEVTDWLAQLSPAQQAAPSCYDPKGTTLKTRFAATAAAGCRPLVRPNYGYFNAAAPRSAPQVIILTGVRRCFDTADKYNNDANSTTAGGCRANRALVETMDKAALRARLR